MAGNLTGLVNDARFQALSPDDQRRTLAGVTQDDRFSSLSDADLARFTSALKAPAKQEPSGPEPFYGAEASFPQGEPGNRIGPTEALAAGIIAAPVMGGGGMVGALGSAGVGGTVGGLTRLAETGTPQGAGKGAVLGAAASLIPTVAGKILRYPGQVAARSSAAFKELGATAGDLPIPIKNASPVLDEAASRAEWTRWPTGLKKIYDRATQPGAAQMTYNDAKDIVTDLGSRATKAEAAKDYALAYKYRSAQGAFVQDTMESLATIGKDAQYAAARADWAKAKQLTAMYQYVRSEILPTIVKGAIGGGALYGGYRTLSGLLGKMR